MEAKSGKDFEALLPVVVELTNSNAQTFNKAVLDAISKLVVESAKKLANL